MRSKSQHKRGRRALRRRGFTLTEVLVAAGLVGLLTSLLLPVVGRMRAAATATGCLGNLRRMGTAWKMQTAENEGRFMDYVWFTPQTPNVAYGGYWPGMLDKYDISGNALLCPAAAAAIPTDKTRGYGNAAYGWTGKYANSGTVIRLNATTYRESSYGYNGYLRAGGNFNDPGKGDRLNSVRDLADIPVFMDAAYVDFRPVNGSDLAQPQPPPNLRGDAIKEGVPPHWLFLLARHRRGINVATADGSARWVSLEDTYLLTWKANWVKYRLDLPAN